jgi:hypothetical protein
MKTIIVDGNEYQFEVLTEGLMSKLLIKKGIVVFLSFQFIDNKKGDFEQMAIDLVKNIHDYSKQYSIHLY